MAKIFSNRFSTKEQVFFAKRLAFLMRAGVPILESLQLLKKQMKSRASVQIFEQVIVDVSNGQYLYTALSKFRRAFGDFAINIIRVGETGGILGDNLNYLAEELKKKQILQRKVMGALVYPIFIVVATLGMTGALTVFVFPKVLPIFTSVNVPLPATTKALIFISHFLIRYGLWVILAAIAAVIGAGFLMRLESFRFLVERTILRLPIVGRIAQSYHLANICRTIGLLLKGETKLDQTISITATTTENLVYRQHLQQISKTVVRGEKVSRYLDKHPAMFPDIVAHMVSIGETSGNLSETFLYLADLYETEVDEMTKNVSGLLEPVLMIFMGLLVGFVAISIITPIYAVTQKLKP